MSKKFHERFGIDLGVDEAKRRFINRVKNALISQVMPAALRMYSVSGAQSLEQHICQKLGERWSGWGCLETCIGNNFDSCLRAVEALYSHPNHVDQADEIAKSILEETEIDIGIRWDKGRFLPSGSPVLDKALVDDVLGLIQSPASQGINQAFTKGLHHLLNSFKKPELLSDVVADMYEALEALAKIVCGNDKDLSANREALVSKLNLSENYKQIMKQFIEYANELHRHAGERGQVKPAPVRREVEAFMYFTGLVIRLALSKDN